MLNLATVAGLFVFVFPLSYDFYTEWLSPRLLSQPWFPGEPNLPPVAGEIDKPDPDDYFQVVLVGYFTGSAVLFIGLLDASPELVACLPYTEIISVYIVAIFALITTFMWYSEGKNVVIPYHSEIRYVFGTLTIVIPLYLHTCGFGIL